LSPSLDAHIAQTNWQISEAGIAGRLSYQVKHAFMTQIYRTRDDGKRGSRASAHIWIQALPLYWRDGCRL